MKIKKLGHCCLVLEINGKRIMTDPGAPDYSGFPINEFDIDVILFTHEHMDHFHVDSLKEIIKHNPKAIIITNNSVGKLLDVENMKYIKVEDGEVYDFQGLKIKGFGDKHAQIYEEFGQVQNTGYMMEGFCYPGDSFSMPNEKVDILAFPVIGPWVLMKDAIDYVKKINPRIAFPVHDAVLKDFAKFIYTIPEHFLTKVNIKFKKLELGKEEEL